jgi:hypothetical protein
MRRPGSASSRTAFAFGLSALSLLASFERSQGADCPPNTIGFPGGPVVLSSTAPARDTTVQSGARGAWDLPIGELRVQAYDRTGIEVTCGDVYTLEGVPPGTPTPFQVLFEVSGDFIAAGWDGHDPCSPSAWSFSVADGANLATDSFTFNCFSGTGHVDRVTTLALVKTAEEAFTLLSRLTTFVSYRDRTSVVGRIRFVGLPPGARVVSCQGFTDTGTTSSRRTSWGQVKTAYP